MTAGAVFGRTGARPQRQEGVAPTDARHVRTCGGFAG